MESIAEDDGGSWQPVPRTSRRRRPRIMGDAQELLRRVVERGWVSAASVAPDAVQPLVDQGLVWIRESGHGSAVLHPTRAGITRLQGIQGDQERVAWQRSGAGIPTRLKIPLSARELEQLVRLAEARGVSVQQLVRDQVVETLLKG